MKLFDENGVYLETFENLEYDFDAYDKMLDSAHDNQSAMRWRLYDNRGLRGEWTRDNGGQLPWLVERAARARSGVTR